MKYLKLFETHTEYQTYINSSDKILPNVSYCEDNNEVHYNPWSDPRIIATFNVTTTSYNTRLMNNSSTSKFSEIEIDGVVQPSVVSTYRFSTTGEHTVKYTLVDPTTIYNSTFDGCGNNLIDIILPKSVTTINSYAFSGVGLTTFTIPDNVTTVGDYAFEQSSLTSVTIPDNVTTIGEYAFSNCQSITSIRIGSGVTSIGNQAFVGDGNVTSISVDSGNTIYDSRNNCNAIIETATNKLIKGCVNTIIPNTVTVINSSAFSYIVDLTTLTISDNVTTIGVSAFYGCTGLTTIIIGSGITTIDDYAFYNCNNLTSFTCKATTPPTLGGTYAIGISSNAIIYVPAASVDTYKAATNWSTYASRIQAIPTT